MDVPTLSTARLRLVPPAERHLAAYAALLADPTFMQRLELSTLDANEAERGLCALVGHWQLRQWGTFFVEEPATGALVGRVGINAWRSWPEPELGWWIVPAAWGRGYAAEAARAVLDYARVHYRQRVDHLVSYILAHNQASVRVAEKLGAQRSATIDFLGGPAEVYVHRLD